MRILFVNPVGQIGGAERVLLDCIASVRLAEPGHEMHLLLMDDGPLVADAQALGASVQVLPAPAKIREFGDHAMQGKRGLVSKAGMLARLMMLAPKVQRYARQLRNAIDRIAPDVIHSNGLKPHLLIARARVRAPVFWHIHDFVSARPMMAKLLRRHADGIAPIAVSNAIADDIGKWLPGHPAVVLMNGVDVARFSPGEAKVEVLDRAGEGATNSVRVGLVATYARWKGHDVFLRAIAKLMREPPAAPVRFYIVGGPIYTTRGSQYSAEELLRLARELGVAEHVTFVPFQKDTPPVYRALDVVVHASTQPEPFGLSVAEAMACGRAVIVSAAGGAKELFEDNVDAIAVRPGDVTGIAQAIRILVNDSDRRIALGAAARVRAEREFDRRRIGPQLLAIYRTRI